MRLRAGLDVLWRAPGEVQIGTDPRWAVRLTDLTDGEVDLLSDIEPGASAQTLRDRAARYGVPSDRVAALLALLDGAHLTVPDPPRRSPRAAPTVLSGSACDAAVWSLLMDDGDGAAVMRARASRVVGVVGLGRLGLVLATTLAAAGVGTLLLEDTALVTSSDLGVGGYRAGDIGTARTVAARRVLHDVNTEVRTTSATHAAPDLLVLVEHGVADPAQARVAMSLGITHLSVVIREASALVGPLVVPSSTPCLRCLDLARADADDSWGVLAAQLAASSRQPAREESTIAAVCGSLAATQVLAHLDGRTPTVSGASLEVTLPEAVPRLRRWSVHPDCGCAGLSVTRPAPASCAAVPDHA